MCVCVYTYRHTVKHDAIIFLTTCISSSESKLQVFVLLPRSTYA